MPEYWGKPSWTHDELDAMIQQFATSNLDGTPWSHVESLLGRQLALGKGVQKGVRKATRQGGVTVDYNDNTKAHVAWFTRAGTHGTTMAETQLPPPGSSSRNTPLKPYGFL